MEFKFHLYQPLHLLLQKENKHTICRQLRVRTVVFKGQGFVHFLRVHDNGTADGPVKFGLNQAAQNIGPGPNRKV